MSVTVYVGRCMSLCVYVRECVDVCHSACVWAKWVAVYVRVWVAVHVGRCEWVGVSVWVCMCECECVGVEW